MFHFHPRGAAQNQSLLCDRVEGNGSFSNEMTGSPSAATVGLGSALLPMSHANSVDTSMCESRHSDGCQKKAGIIFFRWRTRCSPLDYVWEQPWPLTRQRRIFTSALIRARKQAIYRLDAKLTTALTTQSSNATSGVSRCDLENTGCHSKPTQSAVRFLKLPENFQPTLRSDTS